tara:strand:- start:1172 stop:1360 length:189 start_codon:yes stop_codon:yes gene_type:complete
MDKKYKKLPREDISKEIPPTVFKPIKKSQKIHDEKVIEKKKYLDELFSETWKKEYFEKDNTR